MDEHTRGHAHPVVAQTHHTRSECAPILTNRCKWSHRTMDRGEANAEDPSDMFEPLSAGIVHLSSCELPQ